MTQITLFLLALFLANLPWFSEKLFYFVQLRATPKNLWWCLLELLVLYIVSGLLATYAEYVIYGQIAPQGWEFYTVTFCMFLVLSFPGFIYKVMWKK